MKQSDLAAEIGGQSVESDILSGKRAINARQAKALAARFGVSAAAFFLRVVCYSFNSYLRMF